MENNKNNTESSAGSSAARERIAGRRSRTRYSEQILALFAPEIDAECAAQAADLLRRRRVVDFMIQSGRVAAKVFDDQPSRVEVAFKQISPEKWERILAAMSEKSYYLAVLLAGRLPLELEEVFAAEGVELFPSTIERLGFSVDGKKRSRVSAQIAAIIFRLCEKLDEDPFAILTLRGKGREEVLLELRKRRRALSTLHEQGVLLGSPQTAYEPAPPLKSTFDRYWSSGAGLSQLSYTIKADELPASVLKWLDPLPLGGLEDSIDYPLDQAYEKVTRLAQGFGLGL